MNEVHQILPNKIMDQIKLLSPSIVNEIEEIRIRVGKPIELVLNDTFYVPSEVEFTKEDSIYLLNKLSQYSLYTIEEELRQGYITIQGGHRVGLAGKVITEGGRVKVIRDVTFFNIRIAKQKIGSSEQIIHFLYEKGWKNTLIIGPPQTGKTTLLRDIARLISTGMPHLNIISNKVGIVDERSEIAGCVKGIPQHELGPRVDVLDSCPKAEGMMMMIRSMSPDVLVVDEIGRKEDVEAITEAVHAGVKLVVTVHGLSLDDIKKRPTMKPLLDSGVFENFIELSRAKGVGTINKVRNSSGTEIFVKERVRMA